VLKLFCGYMSVLFRPFGSSAILGGYDRDGPQLYMIEPSGVAYVRLLMSVYSECTIIFMFVKRRVACLLDDNLSDYRCGYSVILELQLERVGKLQRRMLLSV